VRQLIVTDKLAKQSTRARRAGWTLRSRARRYTDSLIVDEQLDRLTERHEALTMSMEPLHRDVQDLRAVVNQIAIASQQDGENIRALARVAENHERRLTHLEGEE